MKITKKELKKIIREEIRNVEGSNTPKKTLKNEGIISSILSKFVTRSIMKSPEMKKSMEKFEKSREELKKSIDTAEENGIEVPDELKRLVR